MAYTLRCFHCGEFAYLIRGLCSACDPVLHAQREEAQKAVARMCDEFERATGKNALAHWYEYEAWAEAQPGYPSYVKTLVDAQR